MKQLFLVLLFLGCNLLHAQQFKITGGCSYSGYVMAMPPGTADFLGSNIMTNGAAYTAQVLLNGEEDACAGDVNIKLNNVVIGSVLNTMGGTLSILLDKFNLPDGQYSLDYIFTGTYVNKG